MKIRRRCKCGCHQITSPGSKWILGHNSKINNPYFKHGFSTHKLYGVWINIRARCYNPNFKQYSDYGGRGIRMFIRWRYNFKSFYNFSINNGWKEGLEIDRKDNDGNYHPDNCRFVTSKINSNNRRPEKISKNNTSGYKGVTFDKHASKYRTQPTINGKRIRLGHFDTAKEAAEAIEDYKNE